MTHTPVVCQLDDGEWESNRRQMIEAVCCNLYDNTNVPASKGEIECKERQGRQGQQI